MSGVAPALPSHVWAKVAGCNTDVSKIRLGPAANVVDLAKLVAAELGLRVPTQCVRLTLEGAAATLEDQAALATLGLTSSTVVLAHVTLPPSVAALFSGEYRFVAAVGGL
jgi:hypothetical protein